MNEKTYIIAFIMSILSLSFVKGQDWDRLINLKGSWKFSIGDNKQYANPQYDDEDWEAIHVPRSWENDGFSGYDGYAWYRKEFFAPSYIKEKNITLRLGRIDDVDEVYFNGYLIGATGKFPPEYQSAYYAWREYHVPQKYLKIGQKNVIAVRVYDSQLTGGITDGDIGLFEKVGEMNLDNDLEGMWKFRTGDDMSWKEENFNDNDWDSIHVPGKWEQEGAYGYDGFAWYRLKFKVPNKLAGKKLVLVLGKIDDIDETYLNGKLIGSTGKKTAHYKVQTDSQGEWNRFRGYFVPDGVLLEGKENTIAVRVYDGWQDGGIYQGPIGLIEQNKYTKFWRNYKNPPKERNLWDYFFN